MHVIRQQTWKYIVKTVNVEMHVKTTNVGVYVKTTNVEKHVKTTNVGVYVLRQQTLECM
jgi:hypothetical protein